MTTAAAIGGDSWNRVTIAMVITGTAGAGASAADTIATAAADLGMQCGGGPA